VELEHLGPGGHLGVAQHAARAVALDLHDRRDGEPGPGEVDVGVVAPDHTVGLQAAHPLGDGGRGEVHPAGELVVGEPRIALEFGEQQAVDGVHDGLLVAGFRCGFRFDRPERPKTFRS
jgi:hypothetical protein